MFDDDPKQRVIAVDLDGTLATYDHFRGAEFIGDPIPEMVDKVKQELAAGSEVWIFTARIAPADNEAQGQLDIMAGMAAITKWCQQVFGVILPITYRKNRRFTEMWDDRGRQVYPNTGLFVTDILAEETNGDTSQNISRPYAGATRQPTEIRQNDSSQQAQSFTANR